MPHMTFDADIKADDTKAAEVAILHANGREFVATGFAIDVEAGRMIVYPKHRATIGTGVSYGAVVPGTTGVWNQAARTITSPPADIARNSSVTWTFVPSASTGGALVVTG
mgnify:CR=1 FL=1